MGYTVKEKFSTPDYVVVENDGKMYEYCYNTKEVHLINKNADDKGEKVTDTGIIERIQIRLFLDEIYSECITLPENFGDEILEEVYDRISEDGYIITKQIVLEELLWCYMIKMQ